MMSFDNSPNQATDLLVDTSSSTTNEFNITQNAHLHSSQQQQHQAFNLQQAPLIPLQATSANINSQPTTSAKVAPESQAVVYSVHPTFAQFDSLDALLVKQRADCERTCCGFESTNSYAVRSKAGELVLRAVEQSNCLERCLCEQNRQYELNFTVGDEIVARVVKPYRIARFCCYSNAVRVESPPDNPIGAIKQQFTLFGHTKFAVFDAQYSTQRPVFILEAVNCRFCCSLFLSTCCCVNKTFRVLSVANIGVDSSSSINATANNQSSSLDADSDDSAPTIACKQTRRQVATISRDCSSLLGGGGNSGGDASWAVNSSNSLVNVDLHSPPPPQQLQSANSVDSQQNINEECNVADNLHSSNDNNNNDDSQQQQAQKQERVRVNPQRCNQAFGIQFDANLEPRHKVLLLAACFMLDFYYFETDRRRKKLLAC